MTKAQVDAAVSRKAYYVLAVVDLRGQDGLRSAILDRAQTVEIDAPEFRSLAEEFVPALVPRIRIKVIGEDLQQRLRDYTSAVSRGSSGIRIDVGPELRFLVSSGLWSERGVTLPEWVLGLEPQGSAARESANAGGQA